MDKGQAVQFFWEGFGLPAYDANTVPPSAEMPYITYEVATGKLDDRLPLTASLWYHSMSWDDISGKAAQIAQHIVDAPKPLKIEGGYLWIVQGTPFAQRMSDPEDSVRRIVLNIQAEFITGD